jgi:hypothetical protein
MLSTALVSAEHSYSGRLMQPSSEIETVSTATESAGRRSVKAARLRCRAQLDKGAGAPGSSEDEIRSYSKL